MVTLSDAGAEIAKALGSMGQQTSDQRAVNNYCKSTYTLILNEYLRYADQDSKLMNEFKSLVGPQIKAADLRLIPEMLSEYKGLLFEQLRYAKDPIYNALFQNPLHAAEERLQGMMLKLIREKKALAKS